MYEIAIPSGVKVALSEDASQITISGKLGSAAKTINTKIMDVKVAGGKVTIAEAGGKKIEKKATYAAKAMQGMIRETIEGVEKGIERHMRIVFAHFPISIEIKDNTVLVKNIFGERIPRKARIMGSTKVEIKDQDVFVRGVDQYDVGQTVANITKLSFERRKDSRVFQDGIYELSEE